MRPIAPPPHFRHSRSIRKKQASAETKAVVPASDLVRSWVPFDNVDEDDNSRYNGNEVSITPSFSNEPFAEETGIEAQLKTSYNNDNNDGLLGTSYVHSGSFSNFENIAPVPLPFSSCENNPVCEPIRLDTNADNVKMVGLNRNQPLGSLQSITNQRVVQKKGLGKRTNIVGSAKNKKMRGESIENQRRGSINSADKNQRRSSRSLSVRRVKTHRQKNNQRSSIARNEANRHDCVESNEDERQDNYDGRSNEISIATIQPASINVHDRTLPAAEIPPRNQGMDTSSTKSSVADSDESTSLSPNLPSMFRTRNLLATSVYHNQATGIWITTINMSQKETVNKSNAAKYLKAFSFQTEHEARESAYANAPARMLPFDEHPFCFTCSTQFSVFKRASHCRNCGVCICSSCSTLWKRVCVPETYNIKGEASIRICKSCDSLSKLFRTALLEANYDEALKIYNTGNVNLRCPFMSSKGAEIMLPIHCAAEGGSLDLLVWLVEVHYCPLKRIRTGNRHKTQQTDEMITTSKGRTVLDLAMASKNVDIIRYLVNDKKIDIYGIKDLNIALNALDAVLKSPYINTLCDDHDVFVDPIQRVSSTIMRTDSDMTEISSGLPSYTVGADDDLSDSEEESPRNDNCPIHSDDEESVATTVPDACIICYANSIDCVITPCGHQICCLQCSNNMKTCPVCNVDCKFIRIFRP
mmetsp:Transcript_10832/g.20260  ORF Transcript_10832/g.20260 Transcript_10832/m.20260 type:complete len:698 (-) Transcript_10832:1128-3221(-)